MTQTNWEGHYQSSNLFWDMGEPSPGLVDFLAANANLPGETVCVPGCGTGHEAREWAKAGFRVYGYDLAPSAIRMSIERTRAAGLQAEFRTADFLRDEPPFRFDWVFEHLLFCAIQPVERDLYMKALARWVKPGGHYLAVNYLIKSQDGPPFGTTRQEVVDRLSPQFELLKEWAPRSFPHRTGLEMMSWWRKKTS
jgi:SAM-dependent methyltransferase